MRRLLRTPSSGADQDLGRRPTVDPELITQRDRLVERFAVMQSELGGLFYEMAIRDHIRMEVLMPRAAELQRVDTELGQLQRLIETGASGVGGNCPACGAVYARGAAFCAQCAHPLAGPSAPSGADAAQPAAESDRPQPEVTQPPAELARVHPEVTQPPAELARVHPEVTQPPAELARPGAEP